MTQTEKDLLLKDLCGRLPYFVKVQIKNEIVVLDSICDDDGYHFNFIGDDREGVNIEQVKPYLFPLSSMTEEQKYDFYCRFIENYCVFDDFKDFYLDNGMWHKILTLMRIVLIDVATFLFGLLGFLCFLRGNPRTQFRADDLQHIGRFEYLRLFCRRFGNAQPLIGTDRDFLKLCLLLGVARRMSEVGKHIFH